MSRAEETLMTINKNIWLLLAVIGTVIPWVFFGRFFALNGLDIPKKDDNYQNTKLIFLKINLPFRDL